MSSSVERRETDGARRRQLVAVLVAVAAHGLLLLWVSRLDRSSVPAAETKVLVDLVDPPVPPPPPEELPRSDESLKHPLLPRVHVSRRSQGEPSELRPLGKPEAATEGEASPTIPIDLTGETLVAGTSSRGDDTATGGATNFGVGGGRGDNVGSSFGARVPSPDRSSTVSLENQNWSCAWPREADSEQIDEQTVVIRVVVDADGSAKSAEIVFEPGHGFGQAAVACALRTRFTPARDRAGNLVRAKSPPIRVRFTR
jgi:periplasmic protein TonB